MTHTHIETVFTAGTFEIMRTRNDIQREYNANLDEIKRLQDANTRLLRENCLLSDEKQWFTEATEEWEQKDGRKKIKIPHLVGRVWWNEAFRDGDSDRIVMVKRNRIVRVNNEWV